MLFSTDREPTNVVLPIRLRDAILVYSQELGIPHSKLMATWLQVYCAEQLRRPEVLFRAALLLARYMLGKRRTDVRPSLIMVRDGEHGGMALRLPMEVRWFVQLITAAQEENISAVVARACYAAPELQPQLLTRRDGIPDNIRFLVNARGAPSPSDPNGSGEPVA